MTSPSDADPLATPSPNGPRSVRVTLTGDLDYDTCNSVLHQVRTALQEHEGVQDLHLDCRELGMVDSMGLSTLLQIHRSAGRDGIVFHLDNIGPSLRRLLEITGTYTYLTAGQRKKSGQHAGPPTGARHST